MTTENIDIERLPDLDSQVAVYGAAEQSEVGGETCVNIAIGTYLYSHD